MKNITVIIFLFCLLPIGSLLQELPADYRRFYTTANTYYDLDDPTDETDSLAIVYYQKTIAVVRSHPALSSVLINCHIKAGNIFQGQQRYPESVPFYHTALQLATASKDTSYLYQASLYLGSARYSISEIDSARFYFEYASRLAGNRTDLVDLPILYNSLGIIYFEAANYKQAINYFQLAADRLSPSDESYHESLVSFQNNIAGCYSRLGNYNEALQRYRSLLQYDQLRLSLYQNIGHTFYYLQQYDSALHYLQQVPYQASPSYARLLNEKGRVYLKRGNLQQAELVFDSAIAVFKQLPASGKNKDKATSYLYRSQLAQQQGLSNEAMTWCNMALQELHFSFTGDHAESLPATETELISPITFFQVLEQKAALLDERYHKTAEQHWLKSSLQTRLLAIRTANYIKSNFDNDEATMFFNEASESLYKQATHNAALLYSSNQQQQYLNDFLFITESYKGNILHRNQVQTNIKSIGLLPDSLLKQETALKQLLAVFTTRLNNSNGEEQLKLIQQRITELQIGLSRLHKTYENYPAYSALQNPSAILLTNVDSVQRRLDGSTAVLQYVWSDSVLLCFAISNTKTKLIRIPLEHKIRQLLQDYRTALHQPKEGIRFPAYEASTELYRLLVAPLPSFVRAQTKWIILPDGPLYELPFETLITDTDKRRFLLQDQTISYHYSFTLLLKGQQQPSNPSALYAAAPFTTTSAQPQDQSLPILPYSKEEIRGLKGVKVEDSGATRQHFMREAINSSMIHLATHAVAGKENTTSSNTFIQFYHAPGSTVGSSRLYLHELYSMRLEQQPLVILSACETASGLQSGSEGLLSLARGFMYAGSSGIVSSLWKADDRITAYLMQRLHGYLQKGMAVEQALQKAKTDLLNDETIDARYKSPAYWGQFIYIGSVQLAHHNSVSRLFVISAIVLGIVLVFFVFARRQR
jgi:CHAT domain-containing protein